MWRAMAISMPPLFDELSSGLDWGRLRFYRSSLKDEVEGPPPT